MTVYIDELFLMNFISCLAMLYVFSAFAELERRRWRLIIASITGALLALARFVGMPVVLAIIIELTVPLIAFKGIRFVSILLFILMKYIFSGFAAAAVSVFGGSSAVIRGGIIYFDIPHLLFLAVFIVVYPVFNITLRLLKKHRQRRIYTLVIDGKQVHALYDSGNLLKNPYDQSAVIIAEHSSIDFDESSGFMLIPYKSLNHSSMLKAFKVESVYCIEKNFTIKNVTIGLSEKALSESGQYHALIGPAIFKE